MNYAEFEIYERYPGKMTKAAIYLKHAKLGILSMFFPLIL